MEISLDSHAFCISGVLVKKNELTSVTTAMEMMCLSRMDGSTHYSSPQTSKNVRGEEMMNKTLTEGV